MNEGYLQNLASRLKSSHLFLDTTCLIDSLRHPKIFSPIFEVLAHRGITFVTIDAAAIEFYKGSKSPEHYKTKEAVFKRVVNTIVPTTSDINKNALDLSAIYGIRGKDASSTDYLLGGALIKYQRSKTFLMTHDHGDFPITIFDRVEYLPIGYEYEVHTYVFYKFNPDKFNKQVRSFLRRK